VALVVLEVLEAAHPLAQLVATLPSRRLELLEPTLLSKAPTLRLASAANLSSVWVLRLSQPLPCCNNSQAYFDCCWGI
jgi:hypothetical protein